MLMEQTCPMAYFSEISPYKLRKSHHNHPWHFVVYNESPFERDDNNRYAAFLFRDRDRTTFGICEFFGSSIPHVNTYRKMATRVVLDTDYRKSLVSKDPDLPISRDFGKIDKYNVNI